MPSWRNIKGYTKNDLFDDFKGRLFTLEEFIVKGEEMYSLKEITCRMKLKRGVKEGLVAKREHYYYQTKLQL